jgi:hypothetical protein
VSAVRKHLSYYPGGLQPGIAALVDAFAITIAEEPSASHLAFEREVDDLMENPVALEITLGEIPDGLPRRGTATVTQFVRSSAVAAAVRL